MNVNQVNVPLQPTKEAVLEAIMHEYGEKIIQLAYLIVKDRSMAEDITQEVFIKAYQSLDSFRGDSSLRTWLYRIAINESRKYLRSWSFRNIFSTSKQKKEERMETIDPADVESTVLASVKRAEIAEWSCPCPPNTGRSLPCTTMKTFRSKRFHMCSASPKRRCGRNCHGPEGSLKN